MKIFVCISIENPEDLKVVTSIRQVSEIVSLSVRTLYRRPETFRTGSYIVVKTTVLQDKRKNNRGRFK